MGSIYEQFETNKNAESEGVWVAYGEGENAPKFKVARMSSANKKYAKALDKATKPYRLVIELKMLKDETAEKVFLSVFVDTILLDWKNVKDRNGKVIKFTKENVTQVMNDLPDLYQDLQQEAKNTALFKSEALETEAKN